MTDQPDGMDKQLNPMVLAKAFGGDNEGFTPGIWACNCGAVMIAHRKESGEKCWNCQRPINWGGDGDVLEMIEKPPEENVPVPEEEN